MIRSKRPNRGTPSSGPKKENPPLNRDTYKYGGTK